MGQKRKMEARDGAKDIKIKSNETIPQSNVNPNTQPEINSRDLEPDRSDQTSHAIDSDPTPTTASTEQLGRQAKRPSARKSRKSQDSAYPVIQDVFNDNVPTMGPNFHKFSRLPGLYLSESGNISEIARVLDVSKTQIYSWLRQYPELQKLQNLLFFNMGQVIQEEMHKKLASKDEKIALKSMELMLKYYGFRFGAADENRAGILNDKAPPTLVNINITEIAKTPKADVNITDNEDSNE